MMLILRIGHMMMILRMGTYYADTKNGAHMMLILRIGHI